MSSTVLGRNAVTVNKKYTEYFLPTVLTAMATNIAMIVDSIIAGNLLGQNSLAAINLMSPISQFYFSITILFGLGASSIISFAKGRRDEKQANRVFTSTFYRTYRTQRNFYCNSAAACRLDKLVAYKGRRA